MILFTNWPQIYKKELTHAKNKAKKPLPKPSFFVVYAHKKRIRKDDDASFRTFYSITDNSSCCRAYKSIRYFRGEIVMYFVWTHISLSARRAFKIHFWKSSHDNIRGNRVPSVLLLNLSNALENFCGEKIKYNWLRSWWFPSVVNVYSSIISGFSSSAYTFLLKNLYSLPCTIFWIPSLFPA